MGSVSKNVIICGVDISSTVHIDNMGKDTLILGKGPTQGLDDTTLTVEAQYSVTLSRYQDQTENKVFIIMGATAFYFLMIQK